jgi:DNA-binding MarR family transcriptional regulator
MGRAQNAYPEHAPNRDGDERKSAPRRSVLGSAVIATSRAILPDPTLRELEIVGGRVEALVADVARRHGLSHAALNALAVIEGNGGPLPTGEISARMHITTGTMTTVLDTLERNRYIRRLADPDDRRRVLVDITPAAQTVLDQMLPEVQQLAKAIMGVLDDDALHRLLDTLATLTETIQNSPPNLPPPARRRTPSKLRRR